MVASETQAAWRQGQDALRDEVRRVTALLRSIQDPEHHAVGCWSLSEVAMHLLIGGPVMRRRVGVWFLFVVLTPLLFALGPIATAASSDDYGEYSLMTQRHTGQFFSDGSLAGQWSWTPRSGTPRSGTPPGDESEVSWGDPSKSRPDSVEHFIHAGDWVLLDGWRDGGTYYVQRVSRELIGDGSCRNMTPLPSDGGRQHYVQWTITPQAYCLQAWGTITEQLSGKTVESFFHSQVWSPPSTCRNTYLGARTCIRQWESWWDNNGTPGAPVTRKLERSVYLARGVGMGFVIDQTYPHSWHAELGSVWAS
ncbi:MAG: hypothetical protein ACRDRI_09500 [Pseudonocardiaceae bacterium]